LIPRPSTALAPIFLALLYSVQLTFSQNFIWGPSLSLFDNVDSLILYHLVLVLFSNIFLLLVGLISQSRYAIIGTVRALIHIISLDIFVTILYSLLIFSSQSANFHDFVVIQNIYWFMFLYSPAASAFVTLLLLESKRAPFDHAETESEVVSGYQVEYSGPMLLMFYLAEYLHLVISSVHFTIFFLGGWYSLKIFWFLPPIFVVPHDVNFWHELFNNIVRI
jgi:NADH:ubiquinone oxidoreductase subunit H